MLLRVWAKSMMPLKNKITATITHKKGGTDVPPFLLLVDMISISAL